MKSAIVFGGSRGIGNIIANFLLDKEYKVTIASRSIADLLNKKKDNMELIEVNISDEVKVKSCFESHIQKFKSEPDLVINAAAVQGPIGLTWDLSSEEWQETINVNITGSFNVTKYAVQNMLRKGSGSIILFSGGGAAYSRPNFSAYGVSKTAVLRFVENVADELKNINPSIIINAIAPGAVKTKMTETIIAAGNSAGTAAYNEAVSTFETGGTPIEQITTLVDFLSDQSKNKKISGRLIHVREDYFGFVNKNNNSNIDIAGKLRRVPLDS